jgi:hypothetical protein
MLNDVGVKGTLAVDRVTGDRLCHSAPRTKDPAVYPMPLDASEPYCDTIGQCLHREASTATSREKTRRIKQL